MIYLLIAFASFWLFVFLFNAISEYRTYSHMKKWHAERKAHEDWASINQQSGSYQAMDICGHVAAKSKKEIDSLFNNLPGSS